MPKPNTIKASVYVITERDGKVPVFLRHGTKWMRGYYAIASGQVEPQESLKEAAARELKEELGLVVGLEDLELVHCQYRNQGLEDEWVAVFFRARKWTGEPVVGEPDKHGDLKWYDLKHLPQPMIPYMQTALDAIGQGLLYSEFYDNKNEG